MTTVAFVNLAISLVLCTVLAIAYTYLLNRKKMTGRKRLVLIAAVTLGATLLLHVLVTRYIYSPPFALLLFFILPFLVCLVVSSRFALGKKERDQE